MKFIFPQNYNFNSKIFGIIEYSAAILDLVWGGITYIIINLLFKKLMTKIFIGIILILPVVIFSIAGVQGENLLYYLNYMLKYLIKQKLYFYE